MRKDVGAMSETEERIKREWMKTHAGSGFEDLYEHEWDTMIAEVEGAAAARALTAASEDFRKAAAAGVEPVLNLTAASLLAQRAKKVARGESVSPAYDSSITRARAAEIRETG